MSKIAFVFPGQGAQYTGMAKDFYEKYAVSREVFESASKASGLDVKALCFEENDRLNITEYTQIAMLTAEIAILRAVEEAGIRSQVNAGLSLGEYGALVASGVMKEEDAFTVVRKRGIFMQEAYPTGGAMSAVLGTDAELIEKICNETQGIVSIANYNCPGQQVITGETQALLEMIPRLKKNGAKVIPLKVSGPFHSPFMKPAGEKLERELEQVRLSELQIPYVSNVSAQPITKTEQIRSLLSQGVYSPVKWEQSMRTMLAEGVEYFVEIGPGHTLSTLLKKINAEAKICTVSTMEDLVRMQDFLNETV